MNTWGNNIKISIFGESHGGAIGVVIDGLPAGQVLDMEDILKQMDRRAPGKNKLSTQRKETDTPIILSGIFEGKTTGAPLCAMIKNDDTKSKDYSKLKNTMRPSHADYPARIKFKGFNDYRGGGHFSGRLTAPLVFTGAVAQQILAKKNIFVGAHIASINGTSDKEFDLIAINNDIFKSVKEKDLPIIDDNAGKLMIETIEKARLEGDSVGGIIECAAIGLPVGIGQPFFYSVESAISSLIFSVPAVKGIEFGMGFEIANMRGSEANDQYYFDENAKVQTKTNNNGGILGGLSNGMPIVFKAAFKPTPSISLRQDTVNVNSMEECSLEVNGRHDPCVVQRAVPVIESCAAIALLDLLKGEGVL